MKKRMSRKVPRQKRSRKGTVEQFAVLLRNNMTRAESIFWHSLRKRQKAWKHQFVPQAVVYGYIPDFWCESLKLAIEIDGRIHDRKDIKRKDRLRTRRLNKMGVTVVRFKNSEIFSRKEQILDLIAEVAAE